LKYKPGKKFRPPYASAPLHVFFSSAHTTKTEVIFLQYPNLHSLLSHSRSTRQYFISLPVAMQLHLHEHDAFIHSAEQLRTFVYAFRRP
jgi:hypothetical protein